MVKPLGHIGMTGAERVRANRLAGKRGAANNAELTRKLTDDQVREIRVRRDAGESPKSIEKDYPVSHGAIYQVGLRNTYKEV